MESVAEPPYSKSNQYRLGFELDAPLLFHALLNFVSEGSYFRGGRVTAINQRQGVLA